MATYSSAAARSGGAGLIEHLQAEVAWLRGIVDRLTGRAERVVAVVPPPGELDEYAKGYTDGLAAQERAKAGAEPPTEVIGTVLPFRPRVDPEVIDIGRRIARRLTGKPAEPEPDLPEFWTTEHEAELRGFLAREMTDPPTGDIG